MSAPPSVQSDAGKSLMKAIVSLAILGVKNKSVPSNSIAPASGVVRFTPAVNLSGAVLAAAVPAIMCSLAVGEFVPIPTFPLAATKRLFVGAAGLILNGSFDPPVTSLTKKFASFLEEPIN